MRNIPKTKFRFFSVFAAAVVLAVAALCSACGTDGETSCLQQLDYTESTEKTDNPDQGFYRPIYVRMKEDGVSYNKNIVTDNTRLYHLRVDISAFSANGGGVDEPLTQNALQGFAETLSFLRERNKNAIVRFAYDAGYSGKADAEPQMELLLAHAKQFCTVLNGFPATVTALEAGMFGPWGEMHTSAIATSENKSALIETLLTNTEDTPVLVRTPKMIYDYLGISANDALSAEIPSEAYRLGIYNDGYLGSSSDLGTYSDRERDVAFVSGQSEHLPYGGEVVIPDSPLHNIETCLPEMYQIHLSYLNVEWNYEVIDKWKNSVVTAQCNAATENYKGKSAFTYIENHMGYRFVLKNATFTYPKKADKLKINLTLENVGFGNLCKQKLAKLLFVDSAGNTIAEKSVDVFNGESELHYSVALNLQSGTYTVYLQLYSEEINGRPLYALQFANHEIYDSALQANRIGTITVL